MNPNLKWKTLLILAIILLCFYGLVGLPNPPSSWAQAKANFSRQIKLGLDLQGGTHLILQVQVQEAVSQYTDQTLDRLTTQFREKNIGYGQIEKKSDTQILVSNLAPEQSGAFRDLLNDQFRDWDVAPAAGGGYLLTMKPATVAFIQNQTLDQAEETIRRRIDALGLTEPVIQKHGRGENEILVQLPGEGDPARAKGVIQAGGQLELRGVKDPAPYPSEAEALGAHGGVLPPGTEVVRGRSEVSTPSQSAGEVWYLVDRLPVVTGQDLRSANPAPNSEQPGRYLVRFTLSTNAAPRFGQFTEQNIGRQMAIVLDHRVQTAPVIRGRIEDQGVIEGNFSQDEAQDLALVLRAGALPASIKYLEERTVGPSLGADSIRDGVRASVASLLAVMIFLVFYYRLSGINA